MKKYFLVLFVNIILFLIILTGCGNNNNNSNNEDLCGTNLQDGMEVSLSNNNINCGQSVDLYFEPKTINKNGVNITYKVVRMSDQYIVVDHSNDPKYIDCGVNTFIDTYDACTGNFTNNDEYVINAQYIDNNTTNLGFSWFDIGNANIKRKNIEYDAMENWTANICQVQNQIVNCDLTEYYWDSDMQSAFFTDCEVQLNFHDNSTDLTYEIITTGGGSDEEVRQAFDRYYINHRNNSWNYPYFVCSASSYSVYTSHPSAVGITHRYDPTPPPGLNENDHHNWTFVFNQRVIELDCSQQYNWKFTEKAVLAHELGHAFGIPESDHNNHSGNNSDCCVMHVGYPPCGNIVFCDYHINMIKNSQP